MGFKFSEQAVLDGGIQIKGEDGRVFMLNPITDKKLPLDVKSVLPDLTTDEIIEFVQ